MLRVILFFSSALIASCSFVDDSMDISVRHTVKIKTGFANLTSNGRIQNEPTFYYTGVNIFLGNTNSYNDMVYGGLFSVPVDSLSFDIFPNQEYKIQVVQFAKGVNNFGINVEKVNYDQIGERDALSMQEGGGDSHLFPITNVLEVGSLYRTFNDINYGVNTAITRGFNEALVYSSEDSVETYWDNDVTFYMKEVLINSAEELTTITTERRNNALTIDLQSLPADNYISINGDAIANYELRTDTLFTKYFAPYTDGDGSKMQYNLKVDVFDKSNGNLLLNVFDSHIVFDRLEIKTLEIDLSNFGNSSSDAGAIVVLHEDLYQGDTIRIGG